MLERMGWSKGKGLGRTEQGSTDHIKVKVKNDSYGLGANASHEDKWIAHQDDFNELLAQLNNCHGQNSNGTPPEEPRGFSLEEKSKTSRKRVHYMKFTKGKDLSSRSETDLNCIFGKRAKPPKEQEQESNSGDSSQGETEENAAAAAAPSELDPESITNTVTSTLTMQEYFAQRMARLKNGRGARSAAASEETSPARDDTEEPKKKKKKKKKNKKSSEEVEEEMSNPVIAIDGEENHEPSKKKRKTAKDDHAVTENCEDPSSTRKKKLKKLNLDDELQNGLDQTENQSAESEVTQKKKKKKKKHREEGGEGVDSVATEDTDESVQKKPKKKKKKRE
ncbi:PIN2/TERF1-interacting telomerase inhibitor 1-like isoform X2 [Salarias fasciatus]|nr:PIN2/TERF1-interacting telomerase inhibitor 1-like isoform X2 [Salarias fasciatus]